ncbi:hypothetical protein H2199_003709 [Coniosporium tulheliwenetii]|uniref:Uncharacterized protein n=1 Tax=Coniosporium tulheliwenetii TaxID=3383036 RepID=A0ACC2ZAN0_9PEZI|nr:hypothetical protein H2199_003709 [Cladosporium sp. JES 115]
MPSGMARVDLLWAPILDELDSLASQNEFLKKGIGTREATLTEVHDAIGELSLKSTGVQDALRGYAKELQLEKTHNKTGATGPRDTVMAPDCQEIRCDPSPKLLYPADNNWSRHGWSCTPASRDFIGYIETMWNPPYLQHQEAMAQARNIILDESIPFKVPMDARLLRAAILRDYALSSSNLSEELRSTSLETALVWIRRAQFWTDVRLMLKGVEELRNKTFFQKGLCYFELRMFAEAVYTLRGNYAPNAVGHEKDARICAALAEVELERERKRADEKRKPAPDQDTNAAADITNKKRQLEQPTYYAQSDTSEETTIAEPWPASYSQGSSEPDTVLPIESNDNNSERNSSFDEPPRELPYTHKRRDITKWTDGFPNEGPTPPESDLSIKEGRSDEIFPPLPSSADSSNRSPLRSPVFTHPNGSGVVADACGQFLHPEMRVKLVLMQCQMQLQRYEPYTAAKAAELAVSAFKLAKPLNSEALLARCHFWNGRAEEEAGEYGRALRSYKLARAARGIYFEGDQADDAFEELKVELHKSSDASHHSMLIRAAQASGSILEINDEPLSEHSAPVFEAAPKIGPDRSSHLENAGGGTQKNDTAARPTSSYSASEESDLGSSTTAVDSDVSPIEVLPNEDDSGRPTRPPLPDRIYVTLAADDADPYRHDTAMPRVRHLAVENLSTGALSPRNWGDRSLEDELILLGLSESVAETSAAEVLPDDPYQVESEFNPNECKEDLDFGAEDNSASPHNRSEWSGQARPPSSDSSNPANSSSTTSVADSALTTGNVLSDSHCE